jgi:hypothetical protein
VNAQNFASFPDPEPVPSARRSTPEYGDNSRRGNGRPGCARATRHHFIHQH